MAIVIDDSAVVFSLVSVDNCIAMSKLSAQSSSAQLRPVFTPHMLKLVPDLASWFFSNFTTNQWCMSNNQGHTHTDHRDLLQKYKYLTATSSGKRSRMAYLGLHHLNPGGGRARFALFFGWVMTPSP